MSEQMKDEIQLSSRQSQPFILSAWFWALWIISLLLAVLGGVVKALKVSEVPFAIAAVVWIGSNLVLFLILWLCRCPSCRRFVLFDMKRPRCGWHAGGSRFGKVADGPMAVVLDILLHREFGCPYCGMRCKLEKEYTKRPEDKDEPKPCH